MNKPNNTQAYKELLARGYHLCPACKEQYIPARFSLCYHCRMRNRAETKTDRKKK